MYTFSSFFQATKKEYSEQSGIVALKMKAKMDFMLENPTKDKFPFTLP